MPIITTPGAPASVGPTSGGRMSGYNTITEFALTTVAPANPSRQRIAFHNPGVNDIFIAPLLIQTTGSSVAFTPSNAALGGCMRVFANGGTVVIDGECQGAWQAFAITGGGAANPLTIIESNA